MGSLMKYKNIEINNKTALRLLYCRLNKVEVRMTISYQLKGVWGLMERDFATSNYFVSFVKWHSIHQYSQKGSGYSAKNI